MGIELEADVSLGVAIGGKLDKLHDLLNKKPTPPVFLPLVRRVTVPAGATTVVADFGMPPINKKWNVLSLVTYGVDDHTVLTGANVALYTGQPDAPGLMALKYTPIAVPGALTFSTGVIWCQSGNNVFCSITATAGQSVGINIVLAEMDCTAVA